MTILQAADVAFGYGARQLFRGITFALGAGNRAALVAPNGAGKTTLLRILAGELTPDQGSVVLRRDARVGFYRQSHELSLDGSVRDALLSGFEHVLALRNALANARSAAASGSPADLAALTSLEEQYQHLHGDDLERRVESIAGRLGFDAAALDRPIATLSGGERGRLHLGSVLARRPDLLLLDEPTNHLDLSSIEWLEGFVRDYAGAVLIVSHDRAFLDGTCPWTFELGTKSFHVFPQSYSTYEQARELELERERALVERQQALIARTEEYVRRNIFGQKARQAQSRRKMLQRLERLEKPEDVWQVAESVRFRFAPAPRSGDIVLEAHEITAERGGRRLFSGFDLLVRRGERIAIVGPNGSGKTTLLKLLAGQREGNDRGTVRTGTNVCAGLFDQELGSLDLSKTGIDEIRSVRGDMNLDTIRSYLARFRFWGDHPFQSVASFSGGERSRLALAKLLLEPRNLLFLDEPTNHLDIPAARILEEALVGFEGTTLFVSHDRWFLERVSTRVIVFLDGQLEVYPGSYTDWVESRRPAVPARQDQGPAVPEASEDPDKQTRRMHFERTKALARALERRQRRVEQLEDLIATTESEIATLRQTLRAAPGDQWESLAELATKEQSLVARLDAMLEEWTELGHQIAAEETDGSGKS